MAFEADKREWNEIYAFFKILADGVLYSGDSKMKRDENSLYPISFVQREEHDGTRKYIIDGDYIHIIGENIDKRVKKEKFSDVASSILYALKSTSESEITSPDGVEEFLDEVAIFDLAAKTEDRTDFHIAIYSQEAPLIGFCVRSKIGGLIPLLDGGRTANFKFEQSGVKFASPTVNKINAFGEEDDVLGRMMMIERLGGVLKYNDVADKVFKSNLSMIDLHFPRMLAEMLRVMQLDGITKIPELVEAIKRINPLKIKDELIEKHSYYEYKMKQFLMALAFGMRPAKIFRGVDSAIGAYIFVDGNGDLVMYTRSDKERTEEFLYNNTRFERSSTEKDKYGYLERENNIFYFKLNLKIGFVKR